MARSPTGGSRSRPLKQRVKTARGRKTSSTRWLQRQLNDPYVSAAKEQGLRSRAAFKLAEIDDRYAFLNPGQAVIDLGSAPGGWAQIAARRVNSETGEGAVVAIDILEMEPVPGVEFLKLDFMDHDAPDRIAEALGRSPDVVLSDMAPNTTGHQQTDHLRIMAYCKAAHAFASDMLTSGGTFLAKTRRGGTEGELLKALKRDFKSVKHVKPQASRSESPELFVLATGFRGKNT